ncbi:hypothetical protein ACA910_015233 [Epithemia clementina (nom. ined.)]
MRCFSDFTSSMDDKELSGVAASVWHTSRFQVLVNNDDDEERCLCGWSMCLMDCGTNRPSLDRQCGGVSWGEAAVVAVTNVKTSFLMTWGCRRIKNLRAKAWIMIPCRTEP